MRTPPTQIGVFRISTNSGYASALRRNNHPVRRASGCGHVRVDALDLAARQRPAADDVEAKPVGARVEQDDAGDVFSAQAPARVEAIARRRARQQREAHVVGDGIADKRRHRDLPARDGPADVDEGQLIVAGQDQVVEERQQRRQRQRLGRHRPHRRGQLARRHLAQLAAEHEDRYSEKRKSDQRREPMPPHAGGRKQGRGFR